MGLYEPTPHADNHPSTGARNAVYLGEARSDGIDATFQCSWTYGGFAGEETLGVIDYMSAELLTSWHVPEEKVASSEKLLSDNACFGDPLGKLRMVALHAGLSQN